MKKTFAQRFWSMVHKQGGDACWLWVGARSENGYGKIGHKGRTLVASRVSFMLSRGRAPVGDVCHKCDNRPCVRPDHLFEGSHQVNMQDAAEKGRMSRGEDRNTAKLTEETVLAIRAVPYKRGLYRQLARHFGVHITTISGIRKGKLWSHLGGPRDAHDARSKEARETND